MRDRAVSDVIGFVLIASIVLTSIGVVFVTGFSGLEDARQAEASNNIERAYDVFEANMADIYQDGAPNRATEFKLSDSQVRVGDTTSIIEIEVDGTSNGQADANPFVYSAGNSEQQYTYELGAVFRESRGGAVMQEEPPFNFDQDRTTLQYVLTRAQPPQAQAGTKTVLVRGSRSARSLRLVDKSSPSITLTVTTTDKRAPVWEDYLEEEISWTSACSMPSSNQVECSFSVDEIYVVSTGIELTIE